MSISPKFHKIEARLAEAGGEGWHRDRTQLMDGQIIEDVVEQGFKVATAHGGIAEPGAVREKRKSDIAEFIVNAPTDIRALLEQHSQDLSMLANIRGTARPLSAEDETLNLIQGVHEDYNRGWLDAMREIQSVLDGAGPGRSDAVRVGAEAINDLLVMLNVDPDERGETPDQRSIAEVLASAVIGAVTGK